MTPSGKRALAERRLTYHMPLLRLGMGQEEFPESLDR